jgi:hypothetical protein
MRAAILFAKRRSIYKKLPDLDVYDEIRNALTFNDGLPVVAHPPCRNWGRLHTFSKGDSLESELAVWAVHKVRLNGGVLEHPAHSKLWSYCKLPAPGAFDIYGGTTLRLYQSYWGHPAPKDTFLYVCGVAPGALPDVNRVGCLPSGRIENYSKYKREATPEFFANFLVDLAVSSCQ